MKQKISWHKECLFNMKCSLEEYERRLQYEINKVNKLKAGIDFLEFQIVSAEKEGKDGFDSDRYKKKKFNEENNGEKI